MALLIMFLFHMAAVGGDTFPQIVGSIMLLVSFTFQAFYANGVQVILDDLDNLSKRGMTVTSVQQVYKLCSSFV